MVGVHRLRVYNKSMSENQIKGVLADVLTCILSRLSAEQGKIFSQAVVDSGEDIRNIVRTYVKVKNNLMEGDDDVLH